MVHKKNKYLLFFSNILFLFVFCWPIVLIANSKLIFLTQEEIQWLRKLKTPLKIGVTHIPNQYLQHKNGTHSGFLVDLFHDIELLLNLKFNWIYFNSWTALVEAGKNGEVDIIFLAQRTISRQAYFYFTATVLTQQNKIIVRGAKSQKMELQEFAGKKIAIAKGSAIAEYLEINYPRINQRLVKTELDALKILASGEVEAAISETVQATYYIKKYSFKGLRIGGDTGYDYHLRIASSKNKPILNNILEKALEKISHEHKQALYFKWGYVKEKVSYFDKRTLIYIGIVLGLLISFLIVVMFFNQYLKKEIIKRKKSKGLLTKIIQELEKNKNELQQAKRVAKKANLTKTIFLANMSHELRSPLNAIPCRLKGFHLLIVDDDEINQMLTKIFLEKEGATVKLASNGIEAVQLIKNQGTEHFSAILMDVQMPEMDGIEATQKICALEDVGMLPPIIGLTAYIQQSEINKMMKAGMNAHLSKPIDFLELIRALETLKHSR